MDFSLPVLRTNLPVLNSAMRVALGDLLGNIQPFQDGLLEHPQPCILAGLEYDTPWTRDAAINVWNGAGLLFPGVARNTLLAVLEKRADGSVAIGGQYWDAIIWTTGAWAYYCYTGDRDLLTLALEATRNSLDYFETTEFDPVTGLFRGPACYGDGVAAYPDRYAQTGGSSSILAWPEHNPAQRATPGVGLPMQALSTNCLYANAYHLLPRMADQLGLPADPRWQMRAAQIERAVQTQLWNETTGGFDYFKDPFGGCQAQEGLGHSFAILFGIATPQQARQILQNQHVTAYGIPCVWPVFARYQPDPQSFGRHSGTVWPHVQGFWAEAAARQGDAHRLGHELFRLAELATRDGMFAEIYHPLNGALYGGLQEGASGWQWHSCRRQTWSATAYLRMILMGVLGLQAGPERLRLQPLLPEGLDWLELSGLPYRGMQLSIVVRGRAPAAGCTINGKPAEQCSIDAGETGNFEIVFS